MSKPQNSLRVSCFVDFVPAELRENKRWEVIYYVKCPYTAKLKRKAARVRPMKSITERRKLGKRMVQEINRRLERGWNPFLAEKEAQGFAKFKDASKSFIIRAETQVKKGEKRPDTLRSYRSFLKNFQEYLISIGEAEMFAIKFKTDLLRDFLDEIYYYRENSARTRNNYLNFFKTFSEWMIRQRYISENPTMRLEMMQQKKKSREVISDRQKTRIFDYLKRSDKAYYVVCLLCYYCLIRRTELTKLKVKDIYLKNGVVYVSSAISKNKSSKPVTIPDSILPIIAAHISSASQEDYLFSRDFVPGAEPLAPKKISDTWVKVKKALDLPKSYQWYSLKDTGITNLLKAGVPTIAVRDQARHHSIIQTEEYTPKEILLANQDIKKVDI